MPLFFVLSAIAIYYSLKSRNNRQFLTERFKRLIIPLIFGIFILLRLIKLCYRFTSYIKPSSSSSLFFSSRGPSRFS